MPTRPRETGSSGSPKLLARPGLPALRDFDPAAVDRLERVLEGRPVDLGHDVGAYSDAIGGRDPEGVRVIDGVVDLAHGDAVGDDRPAAGRVGPDVGRVEEPGMAESPERTLVPYARRIRWPNIGWLSRAITTRR